YSGKRNDAVTNRQFLDWHLAGRRKDQRAAAIAGDDRYLISRIIDVAGGGVVGIAAVGGVPLIGAGPVRTAGREAGRRGVEAVAVDQHHLSVNNRGAIRPDQRKGDAARRVEAALQERRVLQRNGGTQRDRGLVGGGAERRAIRVNRHLLGRIIDAAGAVVGAIAAVGGVPLIGAG